MRRARRANRAVLGLGAALLVVVVSLVGLSSVASARRSPTLSFFPSAPIGMDGQGILVTATHFKHGKLGGLSECNVTPGEPTIAVAATAHQEPVGCQPFTVTKTTKSGGLKNPFGFGITTGLIGPPVSGPDSAGNDAAVDALAYPCPPTSAQVSAGGQCDMVFTTVKRQSANAPISFSFESTTTTTVATAPGCTAEPVTATSGMLSMTVNPATCLVDGVRMLVTGSGFHSSNLATFMECNTSTDEPTVSVPLSGQQLPVSCSSFTAHLFTTTATGTFPGGTAFTVLTGTTGPPGSGTDSAGNDAATDAADYPCPPTPAQQAAGAVCVLRFGDQTGDQIDVPLSFGP